MALIDPRNYPPEEINTDRFWAKADRSGGPDACWPWTASISPQGYGKFGVGRAARYAHIIAYALTHGQIPEGMQIDHVRARGCTSTRCVNPAHLEAVPQHVNNIRSDSPTAINARKTHCINGHKFTPENTDWRTPTKRRCRACHRASEQRRRARRAA